MDLAHALLSINQLQLAVFFVENRAENQCSATLTCAMFLLIDHAHGCAQIVAQLVPL